MRYVNKENPNVKILVARGPAVPKGENPNSRVDKWVEFRFGMCETEDPEAMAVLDARRDCIREEDFDKRPGYVRDQDIEAEVERRVRERLGQPTGAAPNNALEAEDEVKRRVYQRIGTSKVLPVLKCEVCGKDLRGRLALAGHMQSHKREKVATG